MQEDIQSTIINEQWPVNSFQLSIREKAESSKLKGKTNPEIV